MTHPPVQPVPGRPTLAMIQGLFADFPLTWAADDEIAVGAAPGTTLAAADNTVQNRLVIIIIPEAADTGIRINFGADATATKPLLPPGSVWILATRQQVRAIRGGAANVTVGILRGVT